MKATLLLASGFLLTACNKPATSQSSDSSGQPESHAADDFEALTNLPDSTSMMKLWVYSKTQNIPAEAFDVEPPKVTVKRSSKDLFEVRAEYVATAKSDLYALQVPVLVSEDGKTMAYTVTELLDRKGAKKVRVFECQVRYGPMNWGRHPDKIKWNWEKPKESGDNMEVYGMGGPYRWATAETFKINAEGTASSNPEILIRGTPDYFKALEKHPKLATNDEQRRKEESEKFDRILEAMPRKSR
jgi:hypothetical protein